MRFNRKQKICYPTFATFEKPQGRWRDNFGSTRAGKPKLRDKIFLWGGFFILALGGAVYLLIFSPVFRVKEITVSGNKDAANGDIHAIAQEFLSAKKFDFLPQNSLIFLSADSLRSAIQQSAAGISAVDIKKILPDKLAIVVAERKAAAVFCEAKAEETINASSTVKNRLPEASNCFFADEAGVIFREAPEIFGSLSPTFYTKTDRVYKLGDEAVASSTLMFAVNAKKELRQAGVGAAGFLLSGENGANADLTAFTEEGWLIYFNTGRPAALQAQIVGVLLGGELKDKRETMEYIDLRIDNRVYYK